MAVEETSASLRSSVLVPLEYFILPFMAEVSRDYGYPLEVGRMVEQA